MLTLDHGKPRTERLDLDPRPNRVVGRAIDPDMPMACEPHVADAICHLLSGFLILEDLAATPPSQRRSVTALAVTAQNISTVLQVLNDCSAAFWRLPQTQIPASAHLGWSRRAFRCRRDAQGDHAEERKPREHSLPELQSQERIGELGSSGRPYRGATDQMNHDSITQPEWEYLLAPVVLHLVGAYRAMETLSASTFPAGAPDSFEIACHCLCTALVTLDTCLAASV